MQSADGKIIPPTEFLGAADRYNLTGKIDRWVVSTILKWYSTHHKAASLISLLNINSSGQSLGDAKFLDFVVDQFNLYKTPPSKICFEITETAAITNLSAANRFMHALKELGCHFSLDDFGAGLSSFEYLKTLPVEYLKISGSFIKDIAENLVDLAMVKSINDIGHVMGKVTIAESVENALALEKLKEIGVNFAQGYFMGEPILIDEMVFQSLKSARNTL